MKSRIIVVMLAVCFLVIVPNLVFSRELERVLTYIEGVNGVQFDRNDVSHLFEFMARRDGDLVIKIAKERLPILLNWMYKHTGYPNGSESFHNLVVALENLSIENIDRTFPPDLGWWSASKYDMRAKTVEAYLFLNIRFGNNATQRLYDEFNIISYGRYGIRTLRDIFALSSETDKPLAIIMVARGDRNGITYRDIQHEINLKELLDILTETHDVRVYEFENLKDIPKGMQYITSKLNHKCDLPIIVSHGEAYSLKVLQSSSRVVRITGKEKELEECRDYLSEHAEGILNSCSTGRAKDGVAQMFANVWGIPIRAPDSTSDMVSEIRFRRDRQGNLKVVWASHGPMRDPLVEFIPEKSMSLR